MVTHPITDQSKCCLTCNIVSRSAADILSHQCWREQENRILNSKPRSIEHSMSILKQEKTSNSCQNMTLYIFWEYFIFQSTYLLIDDNKKKRCKSWREQLCSVSRNVLLHSITIRDIIWYWKHSNLQGSTPVHSAMEQSFVSDEWHHNVALIIIGQWDNHFLTLLLPNGPRFSTIDL